MTLQDLHHELSQLLYIEDQNMYNVLMASIVANSMKLGDPVWLTLIGPSSGGKSQIIRPFTKANPSFIYQLDDLTPNTFMSGSLGMEGSLLGRIGAHGVISMDDLTVLFSKNAEARGEILSQFRMIYDGRFSKSSGNRKEPMEWKGYMGMLSGSTPSIYRFFAEVADMGERFVSYRMKSFDKHKAVEFISNNTLTAMDLDERIADVLKEFIIPLVSNDNNRQYATLTDETKLTIAEIAEHCTLLRTAVHTDERSGFVDEFPEPEMPFRVMKQLTYMAQGLQILNQGPLTPQLTQALEWVGWSLANDKRRAYLKCIVQLDYQGKKITARNISALTGLHKEVVRKGMDQLQALQVITLDREDDSGEYEWYLTHKGLKNITLRLDPPDLMSTNPDIV
jgi:hypothetical protein